MLSGSRCEIRQGVTDLLVSRGIEPKRISFRSPWQKGVAGRWIGSCRRELLDHVVVLNEVHLRRLIRDYISCYHRDGIHDSLEKDTPVMRPVSLPSRRNGAIAFIPPCRWIASSIRLEGCLNRSQCCCKIFPACMDQYWMRWPTNELAPFLTGSLDASSLQLLGDFSIPSARISGRRAFWRPTGKPRN